MLRFDSDGEVKNDAQCEFAFIQIPSVKNRLRHHYPILEKALLLRRDEPFVCNKKNSQNSKLNIPQM